jgi:hypothetical protein
MPRNPGLSDGIPLGFCGARLWRSAAGTIRAIKRLLELRSNDFAKLLNFWWKVRSIVGAVKPLVPLPSTHQKFLRGWNRVGRRRRKFVYRGEQHEKI